MFRKANSNSKNDNNSAQWGKEKLKLVVDYYDQAACIARLGSTPPPHDRVHTNIEVIRECRRQLAAMEDMSQSDGEAEFQAGKIAIVSQARQFELDMKERFIAADSVQFKPSTAQLPYDQLCGRLEFANIIDSSIPTARNKRELVALCAFDAGKQFKLSYRASLDGLSSHNYNTICHQSGHKLIVIKSNHGCIFGACTYETWSVDSYFGTNVSIGKAKLSFFQLKIFNSISLNNFFKNQ